MLKCLATFFLRKKGKRLIRAAEDGDLELVCALLEAGADPNAKEDGNFTALICAAARGHSRVVEALLESGANLHARTKRGRTAADIAIQEGQEEVARLLRAAES